MDLTTTSQSDSDRRVLAAARRQLDEVTQTRQVQQLDDDQVDAQEFESFNFGHMSLVSLPEDLVDLLGPKTQRLALDRNYLPSLSGLTPRFAEFAHIKYLQLRHNELQEFPRAVLATPTLEYLDLKSNQISALPEDLNRLVNLKAFSVASNQITRLPLCIGQMQNLWRFTTRKNPIEFPPKTQWKERSRISDPDEEDARRDIQETVRVKELLRKLGQEQRLADSPPSDANAETPRPTRKGPGFRFPIRPSGSGTPDLASSNSAVFSPETPVSASSAPSTRPLLLPSKTLRIPPSPRTATIRAGQDPPYLSERHRSNSESQMSTTVRQKRMGIQMSRGGKSSAELRELDMAFAPNSDSNMGHSRGFSSGLQNSVTPNSGSHETQDPTSPVQTEAPRSAALTRLSSLPEKKRKSQYQDPYIELAQSLMFSMDSVETPIRTSINATKSAGSKRRSLERSCYGALTLKKELSETMQQLGTYDEETDVDQPFPSKARNSSMSIRERCEHCVASFAKLLEALEKETVMVVEKSDARYVRLMMHMLYAGTVEVRNAYSRFDNLYGHEQTTPQSAKPVINEDNLARSPPSAERPLTRMKVQANLTRLRRELKMPDPNQPIPPPRDRQASGNSFAGRSISNASATYRPVNPSGPLTPLLTPNSSSLSIASENMDENTEDQLFTQIWEAISLACENARVNTPNLQMQMVESKFRSPQNNSASRTDPYDTLVEKCARLVESSSELSQRLRSSSVTDPRSRDATFWQLCTSFTKDYYSLGESIRKLSSIIRIPEDTRFLLRPIHKQVKAAVAMIDASPWSEYAIHGPQSATTPRSSTFQFSPPSATGYFQHPTPPPVPSLQHPRSFLSPVDHIEPLSAASSRSNHSHLAGSIGSGPVTPLPATPISAMLGPAAGASISTNGNSSTYSGNGLGVSGTTTYGQNGTLDQSTSLSRSESRASSRNVSRSVSQRR